MNGRGVSRILMILLGVVAAVSIGGLITTAVVGVTGDEYGSYGELSIPGSGDIHLPAGEVMISFHVRNYGGRGLTLPRLNFDITPPPGVADPTVTEDFGPTVSVNDDAHRRVWFMRVPVEGDYRVITDGQVGGYADPRLAFGQTSSVEGPLWLFAALSMISVDLGIAAWWFTRRARRSPAPPEPTTVDPYTPSDEGVRLEQLKTISALRDSGALTEKEFQEEKRRILEGR
ncbi:MAG: SHOCT domain-containing protein [Mycobacterium sp.]|nr:SHOCT domain-containing protein [Mycobacterium sp.]